MLKGLYLAGLSWLTHLFNVAWRYGTTSVEWQTGVVVPIFQKSYQRVCSNYRVIALRTSPEKFTLTEGWPSSVPVLCGLGKGIPLRDSVVGAMGSMGYQTRFGKLFGLCITKSRAVSALLAQF